MKSEAAKAETPKASSSAATAAEQSDPPASSQTAAGSAEAAASSTDDSAESKRPLPRYDTDSFSKWAKAHPEEALAVISKVAPHASDEEFRSKHIALERKRKRFHEEQAAISEQRQREHDAIIATAASNVEKLQPIVDLVLAGRDKDFEAVDELFKVHFGVEFDDWARARLRRGMAVSPEERAAKLAAKKLAEENAALKAEKEKPAAKEEPKVKSSGNWVDKETSAEHGVRELNNWQAKVQAVLDEHVDEDDGSYTITVEDAADRALAASLAKLGVAPAAKTKAEAKPEVKPKPKPKPAAKPKADEAVDIDGLPVPEFDNAFLDGPAPKDMNERQQWAIGRAQRKVARSQIERAS